MNDAARGPEGESPTAPCILARGLYKAFGPEAGKIVVLSGLDLTVESGESVAVVGASGIGKSTLLHILGGLDRPDAGRLYMKGEDVFCLPEARLAGFRNRNVGFVFQFHHLLPEFTALENTAMPVLIAGEDKQEAREKAAAVLARVGLSGRLRHRIGELSGGEQQRVAVARALVRGPAVLLADEPTGNLDKKTGARIHELLAELNAENGMTIVVVTHNMDLARMMGRMVTLSDGKIEELEHRPSRCL